MTAAARVLFCVRVVEKEEGARGWEGEKERKRERLERERKTALGEREREKLSELYFPTEKKYLRVQT